jgi:hypothetical protein
MEPQVPRINTRSATAAGTGSTIPGQNEVNLSQSEADVTSSSTLSSPPTTINPSFPTRNSTPINNTSSNIPGLPPTSMSVKQILAQLGQAMTGLINNQNNIQQTLATNTQGRQGYSSSPAPNSFKEPKVLNPDKFDGRRDYLSAFLAQVELIFDLQPSRFPSEEIKTKYVISLLRGTPLNAIRPSLSLSKFEQPDHLLFYKDLVSWLKTNYGDPDERGTAERKLSSLTQKGSASTYFAEFQQYAAILDWMDDTQYSWPPEVLRRKSRIA